MEPVINTTTNDQTKIVCYYCGENPAPDKYYYYKHTLYYIHKRTVWPGYKYSEKNVLVPRCKTCFDKSLKFGCTWFLISYAISFGGVWFWIYSTDGEKFSWSLGTTLGITVISLFAAGFLYMFIESIFSKKTIGIPPESEIGEYPPVRKLLDEGWLLERPDPGSHPQTAKEIRESGRKNDSHV